MDFQKTCVLTFLYFSFLTSVFSQDVDSIFLRNTQIQKSESNQFLLEIDNNNFVKNNEYFGAVAEGYTLLGFNVAPRFVYVPGSKVKLSIGGNFLSYYGRENEVDARLLLSFQYKIHPHLDFVIGNIYGTTNHRLIAPLFEFERYLNKNIENGIQFLWNSERIFADLWLDWEQQILHGDPFQEIFNVGLSSDFTIIDKSDYRISVPFQNLIRHEGGQINSNSEKPLTTIFNNATGVRFSTLFNQKIINKIDLSSFIVNYQDLSPQKRQMFIDGTGSYSSLTLSISDFDLTIGYWYGKQYIAPLGNPLFESYSRTKFYVEEPFRQLAIGKLSYHQEVLENINLGARFEGFYDIPAGNTEYTWAIMVVFKEKFFLKKF